MSYRSLLNTVWADLCAFGANRSGVFAQLYAVAIIPLLLSVGVAIDYRNAQAAQSELRDALDSALLAAARSYSLNTFADETDRRAVAEEAGRAIFERNLADATVEVDDADIVFSFDPTTIRVSAEVEGRAQLIFGGLFGLDHLSVEAGAAAQGADRRRVEVVLALDNTGSTTSNNRMTLMRAAAQNFVDYLFDNGQEDNLYIGLVPWTHTVNIAVETPKAVFNDDPYTELTPGNGGTGLNTWNKPSEAYATQWVRMPADHRLFTLRGGDALDAAPPIFSLLGTLGLDANEDNLDDLTGLGLPDDDLDPDFPGDLSYSSQSNLDLFKLATNDKGWRGCIRAWDNETGVASNRTVTKAASDAPPPAGTRFYPYILEQGAGNWNGSSDRQDGCPSPMLGLSADRKQVKQALEKMAADGNTYQNLGLTWAMRMLSPESYWVNLFKHTGANRPKAYDPSKTRKVIILLTDGENVVSNNSDQYYGCTQNANLGRDNEKDDDGNYVYRSGAGGCWRVPGVERLDNTVLNNLMRDACAAARGSTYRIELYTIAVDVRNTSAISLLDECAGGPNSPRLQNIKADQIDAVLLAIAKETLRITK